MNCCDFFDEKITLLHLHATTADEAILSLGDILLEHSYVKPTFTQNVLAREKEFATGLPLGEINVALPHTDSIHVHKQGIAVGVLDDPVDFHMMGKPEATLPVRLVFMLAIKENNDQIDMLQMFANVLQQPEFVQAILSAQSTPDVVNSLRTWFTS
ncbi:MAG TPA: PTS sugar transporter subunit IIA [Anaerolineaceae bacterium]|nr:PTS sugar transporter subunit IIA [Anaerolineaceae bacterium]